ncbi:hypothetical protein AAT19DRAFT_9285 [Rhodotorula toruloides]|uniref:Uncharacterized protein n=1 Tax=Rhodotorula toruloides TaxID=5286 RepID=A0A2T0AJM2_RHOTO|nr:hypothetical protein AAT19DRAFT_9285 [Rhodotorula toruloides]
MRPRPSRRGVAVFALARLVSHSLDRVVQRRRSASPSDGAEGEDERVPRRQAMRRFDGLQASSNGGEGESCAASSKGSLCQSLHALIGPERAAAAAESRSRACRREDDPRCSLRTPRTVQWRARTRTTVTVPSFPRRSSRLARSRCDPSTESRETDEVTAAVVCGQSWRARRRSRA